MPSMAACAAGRNHETADLTNDTPRIAQDTGAKSLIVYVLLVVRA